MQIRHMSGREKHLPRRSEMEAQLIKKNRNTAHYIYQGKDIYIGLFYPGPAVEVLVRISKTEIKTVSRSMRSFSAALEKAVEYIDGGNSND